MSPPPFVRRLRVDLDQRIALPVLSLLAGLSGATAALLLNTGLEVFADFLHRLPSSSLRFLYPGLGAAVSVVLLTRVLRDRSGHGVPEVIYSITQKDGYLKRRTALGRLIGCILTIGTGGSAGPEAPVVVIGSALSSAVGRLFRLRTRERICLVAGGGAAAIAAIFNAPMAGLLFSLEVILGEWNSAYLVPIAIASVTGTIVSRLFQGNRVPFSSLITGVPLHDLFAGCGLAVLTAFGSVLFSRSLRGTASFLSNHLPRRTLRAFVAGTLVGLFGLAFPQILGDGYGILRRTLHGEFSSFFLFMLLLFLVKLFASSLTIGSGGTGGLFAPCLVLGAFLGAAYQDALLRLFPNLSWATNGYYPLLGMAGLLTGVLHAPLTAILLISEITGSYHLLVSVTLVAAVSLSISHLFEPVSFYHKELLERRELMRPRTDRQILHEIRIPELLETDCEMVHPRMFLADLIERVKRTSRNYFPVEDPQTHRFLGLVCLNDIREYLFETELYHTVLVEELMDTNIPTVTPDDDLVEVFDIFDRSRLWSLPVVSPQDGRFLGLISKSTIMDHYRKELLVQEEF